MDNGRRYPLRSRGSKKGNDESSQETSTTASQPKTKRKSSDNAVRAGSSKRDRGRVSAPPSALNAGASTSGFEPEAEEAVPEPALPVNSAVPSASPEFDVEQEQIQIIVPLDESDVGADAENGAGEDLSDAGQYCDTVGSTNDGTEHDAAIVIDNAEKKAVENEQVRVAEQLKDLQDELAKAVQRSKMLEESNQDLAGKLAISGKHAEDQRDHISDLEDILQEKDNEKAAVESKLDAVRQELADLRTQPVAAYTASTADKQTIDALREELAKNKDERKKKEEALKAKSSDFERTLADRERIAAALDLEKTKAQRYQEEVANLQQSLSERDSQARSREQAKKTAEAEKRHLEKEVSLLRAENKKLQSKLADAQKAEEKQRDEKREKREALERAKKRLREEEERHEGTKNCLKRRIDELANAKAKLQKTEESLRSAERQQHSISQHSETKRKLQSAQEHSAELEIDVQRLSGQVQVLEKQLKLAEEKDKELATAHEDLMRKDQELLEQVTQNYELQEQLEASAQQLRGLGAVIEHAQHQLRGIPEDCRSRTVNEALRTLARNDRDADE